MLPAPHAGGLLWRKSTRSAANGNCVEVAMRPDVVAVRDSKDPSGPVLHFDGTAWRDFIGSVRTGTFNRPAS